MTREEIKNKIIVFLKEKIAASTPTSNMNLQSTTFTNLLDDELKEDPTLQRSEVTRIIREIVQEFITNGLLYVGKEDGTGAWPWVSITDYGKKCIIGDETLPYDPEGYLGRLGELDSITLEYIGESITAYNRRMLLSSTITLGAASENLILTPIDSYKDWMTDTTRKKSFEDKIENVGIYRKFEYLKEEISKDKKKIPKELRMELDTYLDTVFNFIRLNRNAAGHPSGRIFSTTTVYSNLQVFGEYSSSLVALIDFFSSK